MIFRPACRASWSYIFCMGNDPEISERMKDFFVNFSASFGDVSVIPFICFTLLSSMRRPTQVKGKCPKHRICVSALGGEKGSSMVVTMFLTGE